jgi:beta-carotene 3-hydroxylase
MTFLLYVLLFFAVTEAAAYVLHRFLFHGPLWFLHRTHHEPGHGLFEWNDLFSLFFAGIALFLLWQGRSNPLQSVAFAAGTGITLYGISYFIVHDVFTHGRFFRLKLSNRILRKIRNAHRTHHTDTGKHGMEPYGLFLFMYHRYRVRN